jgi:hypothetical protein
MTGEIRGQFTYLVLASRTATGAEIGKLSPDFLDFQ